MAKTRLTISGTSMPVSSMSTEMAMVRSGLLALALEIVDQFLGSRIIVVDDVAELAAVLRIHLVEEFCSRRAWLWLRAKMIVLPTRVPAAIADAVLHQVPQDEPVGVLVEDDLVDLPARTRWRSGTLRPLRAVAAARDHLANT